MVEKYETMTVKVPVKLAALMKATDYFGKTPDAFLTDCIRSGCSGAMSQLDYEVMQKLTARYSVEEELLIHRETVKPPKMVEVTVDVETYQELERLAQEKGFATVDEYALAILKESFPT